jgi:hypothetical protein
MYIATYICMNFVCLQNDATFDHTADVNSGRNMEHFCDFKISRWNMYIGTYILCT